MVLSRLVKATEIAATITFFNKGNVIMIPNILNACFLCCNLISYINYVKVLIIIFNLSVSICLMFFPLLLQQGCKAFGIFYSNNSL